jgi:2-polyprenyl-3-methyl-5-hydroxy-6-metoxy-1,4-benzoquinol methylase
MSTDQNTIFPQNGYAHLTHFKHQCFSGSYDEIKQLERAVHLNVLRYWDRRWEYPFFLCSIQCGPKDGAVLDAGAGRSILPFWLYKNGYRVSALDVDDGSFYPPGSLSEWYKERNKILNSDVELTNGSVEQLHYDNDTFDIVCSMSVLEHVSDPLLAIRELWRVLKPSGILVVTVDISLDGSRQLLKRQYEEMKGFLDLVGFSLFPTRELDSESVTTDWFRKNEPSALPWEKVKRPFKDRIHALVRGDLQSTMKWRQHFDTMAVAGLAYRK